MTAEKAIDLMDSELKNGTLEVRLAQNAAEVDEVQALRYRVFYENMGATPSPDMAARQRDFDKYDDVCDHLLVMDHTRPEGSKIVGTYRLIRRAAAEKVGGFYSASEYDIHRLVEYEGEILELGRSCIDAEYRTGAVMQILWRGLSAYMFRYDIKLMFGCASFPGADPAQHAQALSYLYHHHLAPPALRPKALPERYVDMQMMKRTGFNADAVFENIKMDPRAGATALPPLIKGYLRVGAYVGDGAVIDTQWNSVDVCIIVKTELITGRYLRHYERQKA